ncbi:MAG TPA: hypothetical protein VF142_19340, partial [Longimicrobium sp.]
RGIPRLLFLIEDNVPVPAGSIDTGAALERLTKLKSRLTTEQIVSFFKSPQDLHALVVEGLRNVRRQMDAALTRPSAGRENAEGPRRKGEELA